MKVLHLVILYHFICNSPNFVLMQPELVGQTMAKAFPFQNGGVSEHTSEVDESLVAEVRRVRALRRCRWLLMSGGPKGHRLRVSSETRLSL